MPNKHVKGNCEVCNSYLYFKHLIRKSIPVEEAFHNTVAQLEENLNDIAVKQIGEDFYDEGHAIGYREGFISGMETVAKEAMRTVNILEEGFVDFREGDEPSDETENVDCVGCDCESECVFENRINRAAWEK